MEKSKNLYSLFVDLYNFGDDQEKFIILVNIINFYYMEDVHTLTYSKYEDAKDIIKGIIKNLNCLFIGLINNFKHDQLTTSFYKEFIKIFKELNKKYNLK